MDPATGSGVSPAQRAYLKYSRIVQTYLDKTVIYPTERWIFFFFSIFLYMVRVYFVAGFYIVSYALGIYLLNLVIGFLSPAIDPEEMDDFDGVVLPTVGGDAGPQGDEFRPFSRKLPEFKFWVAATRFTWCCMFATFFEVFDLPVFWPILLMYFFMLVFITLKDRVKHMIKYKYVPFSWGKQTYKDLTKVNLGGPENAGGAPGGSDKGK